MNTIFRNAALTGVALSALAAVPAAHAQSTGTLDFGNEIVVTAHTEKGVAGAILPDTSKASAAINQTWIERQTPGQAINSLIDYLPGVSFQNNDPYGMAGGTLMIRGFDSTRISETLDGVTLNDDGNYALYANSMLDSEVTDQITVNLGTTDVDSPTSSASGSTINVRSHVPTDVFHAKGSASFGTDQYYRLFGMVDTGEVGPWGTKAYGSFSHSYNESPYNNFGKIHHEQANGRIYQKLGNNGDFLSLAGTYLSELYNFSGYVPLSNVALTSDTGTGLTYMPTSYKAAYYNYSPCTTATATAGTADTANSCGSAYDYRFDPTRMFSLRGSARITLAPGLVFTADPSLQFTKANGGGTSVASEGTYNGSTGYIGGTYYFGRDLNGDGDTLDKVRIATPSETATHRVALTSSLRWSITPSQTVRVAYAYSHSVINQTGETALLNSDGTTSAYFPINAALTDVSGNLVEKRDTHSIATLNQVSGEYSGAFLDDKLKVNIGLRAPFLHRDLTNYCFARNASGGVSCAFGASATAYAAALTAAGTAYGAPQERTFDYHAVLPNVGLTLHLPQGSEVFANYSKGMSAPQTTALYQSFYFASSSGASTVLPEKTDNFDLGYRFNNGPVQAQLDGWYTHYTNRLGSAYVPDDNTTIYTNLGTVNRYGIDGNLSYRVSPHFNTYVFGSWIHSRIDSNVQSAAGTMLQTAGKFESAVPLYTVGARAQATFQPFALGLQVKRTGPRYVNDQNLPYYLSGTSTVAYDAKTPAYTLVDLDLRAGLQPLGLNERSYFQLNVTNLFNQYYVGGFSATYNNQISYSGTYTQAQIGAPRAAIASLVIAY